MIWWDIKKLENDICNNELTDKDGFYYFLIFITIRIVGQYVGLNFTENWINTTECIVVILINIYLLRTIYNINNDIDGKNFFKRYFAIFMGMFLEVFIVDLIPLFYNNNFY